MRRGGGGSGGGRRRWLAALAGGALLASAQPALTLAAELTIRPASYRGGGGSCSGATLRVQIAAEPNPNPSHALQVGFFESSSGAIGDQMNASGWLSALVAAELADADLRDYRLSYSWAGLVDGPSAGGLMTSAVLALMRGESLLDDATMTGTINPDGTIGPVGGIAYKIQGVAEANIRRFAIPLGKRLSVNACTGETEDLVEVGRALGVEVTEVGDIYEAYTFLTGITLPRPDLRPIDAVFPEDLRRDFRDLHATWLQRYEAAARVVAGARPPDFPDPFRVFWQDAEAFLAASRHELQAGHEPAAFNRIWMAVLNAEFVARAVTAMRALNTRGFPGLHDVVERELELAVAHVADGLDELWDVEIVSITDAGAVAGMGNLIAASFAYLDQADWALAEARSRLETATPADFEEIGKLSFEALGQAGLAGTVLDLAVGSKGWMGRDVRPWRRNAEPINGGRELYRAAARSNLRYVDTLHTAYLAEVQRLDLASAQAQVRRSDPVYLAATGALELEWDVFDLFEDDYVAGVAQLGALMGSVANAAVLVAKYYSLGVETDALGRVVGLDGEPALQRMMALAEDAALRAVAAADDATLGAATPMLTSSLDVARRNRDAAVTAQDQLTALAYFWGTSMNARLMVRLAQAE